MKPIEAMAKAMWDYANDGGWDLRHPDGPTNAEREHYRGKARAALLALAECDFQPIAKQAGLSLWTQSASIECQAILRAVAEQS